MSYQLENLIITRSFFIEDVAPCSINNAYSTETSSYKEKSPETRRWLYDLKMKFKPDKHKLDEIRRVFDRRQHYILAKYLWFLPNEKLFRQSERGISAKSNDCSNIVKIPEDLLFGTLLGIDDGTICHLEVDKLLTQNGKYCLFLKIQVRMIKDLLLRSTREWPGR